MRQGGRWRSADPAFARAAAEVCAVENAIPMPALISPFLASALPSAMLRVWLFVRRCFSEQVEFFGLILHLRPFRRWVTSWLALAIAAWKSICEQVGHSAPIDVFGLSRSDLDRSLSRATFAASEPSTINSISARL